MFGVRGQAIGGRRRYSLERGYTDVPAPWHCKSKEAQTVATNGPDPRAAARGFIALVLDQARIDPERRPSAEMRSWCVQLASRLDVPSSGQFETTRDLLREALRLEQVAHMVCGDDTEPPSRELREFALQGGASR